MLAPSSREGCSYLNNRSSSAGLESGHFHYGYLSVSAYPPVELQKKAPFVAFACATKAELGTMLPGPWSILFITDAFTLTAFRTSLWIIVKTCFHTRAFYFLSFFARLALISCPGHYGRELYLSRKFPISDALDSPLRSLACWQTHHG